MRWAQPAHLKERKDSTSAAETAESRDEEKKKKKGTQTDKLSFPGERRKNRALPVKNQEGTTIAYTRDSAHRKEEGDPLARNHLRRPSFSLFSLSRW